MNQVDFEKIRGNLPNGQRGSFEELVCQLARRESLSLDSFRRIEGSGGDGGVECLHISSNDLVGYQAKFHITASDIDWRAIDHSVETALSLHPSLTRYVIALPCDFTGRRRSRGNAVSEGTWGTWDEHRQKWESLVQTQGRSVEFIPWTAAELRARLTPTNADGLRAYWFTEVEFSAQWFQLHVESAIASLDERYNPQDHVDVRLQHMFDVLVRHPRTLETLERQFSDVRRARLPQFSGPDQPPTDLQTASEQAIKNVLLCQVELHQPAWLQWDQTKWLDTVRTALSGASALRNWCWQQPQPFDYQKHCLNKVEEALASLASAIENSFVTVESHRLALLSGTAGSGKSHLLARMAETAIADGRPVVLWLGQQLREQPLWPQLLQRIGLAGVSPDQFLGALDAAAEAAGTRALLLVDALNEGAGARLWRPEIAAFLQQVHLYPSIAVVLTCRSEYIDYLIPPRLLNTIPRIEVRGFENKEEEEAAARVYLDKRGISRPATPWLAPEFVNPLFLRSCCNALQREGSREFPKGLAGTKAILSFYLESVARHLGAGRDGSNELVGPTKKSLTNLAAIMATTRRNYVSLGAATLSAADAFQPYTSPASVTWLDVLRQNGLLRLDPDPDVKPDDPLAAPLDVVRFSFQRFQDHLMADALLSNVVDLEEALKDGGSLAFVRTEKNFKWEWRGLVEALSIQVPERSGREFIDALPGGTTRWWSVYFAQEAFLESVRWRSCNAFTDRTLELFNRVLNTNRESLSRLIELSASIDHPWNADLIHRNLSRKPMHKRDAFWTVQLNTDCEDEQHSVHRLIDWCLRPEIAVADVRTIRLCAITVAWLFTLSNRPVRDRATKALAHLLMKHSSVLFGLVREFDGVDDPYVWERIFGAAYGAACNDLSPARLRDYAQLAADTLFLRPDVPEDLLLRDYGRGLVQLAEHHRVLPENVEWERCRPPYGSPGLRLSVTKAQVAALAKKAENREIVHSCENWGDFGRYEIEPVLSRFTANRLTRQVPLTPRGRFNLFEREVVDCSDDRQVAWEHLRSALADITFGGFRLLEDSTPPEAKPDEDLRRRETADLAERAFEDLLTPVERRRYRQVARGYLRSGRTRGCSNHARIDIERAQLWVARRAYELGRAAKGFPWSEASMAPDRSRPRIERIGKKYQWIALEELMCRLADNYWIADEYNDETTRYEYPTDIGFVRDIDPTIIIQEARPPTDLWMGVPEIVVETETSDRAVWPFAEDRGPELEKLISRTEPSGRVWMTAYEHQHADEPRKRNGEFDSMRPYGREEFRFVYLVLAHRSKRHHLVQSLASLDNLDIRSWDPPDFVDHPYLLEAAWRPTWISDTWISDRWGAGDVPVAFPLSEYRWESHLDLSLSEGHHEFLPSPWLLRKLGLSRRQGVHGTYEDESGVPRMIQGQSGHHGTVALLDRDWFSSFLERESFECIWLYLNERNSLLGERHGAWRRTQGIAWLEGDSIQRKTWHRDRTRNDDDP